jgi:Protein of unknown function (DUF4231)
MPGVRSVAADEGRWLAMSDTEAPATAGGSTRDRLLRAIQVLSMHEDKKEWMRDRWLDQVLWFDGRARAANLRYSALRVVAIAGGVLVPALVSLNPPHPSDLWIWDWVKPTAFVVSLAVAAAVGLDGFFHYGERWRHFRRTAELLKTEGWLFIEGGGRYKQYQHRHDFHERVFPLFATKVEELVRRDVEVYLTRIVQEKPEDSEREDREVRRALDASEEAGPLADTRGDEPSS